MEELNEIIVDLKSSVKNCETNKFIELISTVDDLGFKLSESDISYFLHWAVQRNNIEITEYLLKKYKHKDVVSLFRSAVENDSDLILSLLLSTFPDINIRSLIPTIISKKNVKMLDCIKDRLGYCGAYYFAMSQDIEMYKYYNEMHGIFDNSFINYATKYDTCMDYLFELAIENDTDYTNFVCMLIENNPQVTLMEKVIELNIKFNPVIISNRCINYGRLDLIKYLVSLDLFILDEEYAFDLNNLNLDTLKYLIEIGFDFKKYLLTTNFPLDLQVCDLEILQYIYEFGVRRQFGSLSFCQDCITCNRSDIIDWLVKLGVCTQFDDLLYHTLTINIDILTREKRFFFTKYFIQLGANIPDIPTDNIYLINDLSLINYLESNGFNISNHLDDYLLNSVESYQFKPSLDFIKYIVELGADIHIVDDCILYKCRHTNELYQYLLSKGSKIAKPTRFEHDQTIANIQMLEEKIPFGNIEIIKLMNVEYIDNEEFDSLAEIAFKENQPEIAEYFLSLKVD